MNIAMYTCYLWGQNFPTPIDAFRHYREEGVLFADIVDSELSEVPLHRYCSYLSDAGMKPGALVSSCDITNFILDERSKNIDKVKSYIDRMDKIGIPNLVIFPSVSIPKNTDEFYSIRELMTESLNKIVNYVKDSAITVSIENGSEATRPYCRVDDLSYILENTAGLSLTFDTGNFFCIGQDVVHAYNKLHSRVARVHIKDWKTNIFGEFVRENIPRFSGVSLGNGEIPLKELVSLLKTHSYDGDIVIEINSATVTGKMLDESVNFLRGELSV